jgi:hypothetical protein
MLTALLIFCCNKIENLYLSNYGFFYDPVAYYTHNIELYQMYLRDGTWPAMINELATNNRHPLRTIPILALAPDMLATPSAHLWTETPLLFAFLSLLGTTVYARSKSLLVGAAAMGLFAAFPFLYDPKAGLAAYWLDLSAALAMGSAALCLLRFSETKNNSWIIAFGCLASVTALSRWSAASYLILYAALAVPLACIHKPCEWRATGKSLALALLAALPGLAFTFFWLKDCSSYYSQFGYALNAPISQSVMWAGSTLQRFLSLPILSGLALLTLVHLFLLFRKDTDRRISLICLWLPLSVFIFVCVFCRAVEASHALVYFAPALIISAFGPFTRTQAPWHRIRWRSFGTAGLALAATTGICSYEHFRHLSANPDAASRLQKQSDVALAGFISQANAPTFIQFDTQRTMPLVEAFFSHRRHCLHPHWFSVHAFDFTGFYPGSSPEQVAVRNYDNVKRDVALVAVFQNPEQARQPNLFSNPYSAAVSSYMSSRVKEDKSWQYLGAVNGPRGMLAVYQNTSFDAASWAALRGSVGSAP